MKKTKNTYIKNNNILSTTNNISFNIYYNKEQNKTKNCFPILYNMIRIDANNTKNRKLLSKYELYISCFEEALKYEKRNFCEIVFITFILKEKIINTLFFKSPLEVQSLRICLLIFIYSCNFSLNTLFYFSNKISDKYHYKGNQFFLFSCINNISISIISTILSSAIVLLLKFLISSSNDIIKLFRIEEIQLQKNKKYIVKKDKKNNIFLNLQKILKKQRIKIIICIIIELLFLLFFFYFTTAYCEVYKSTQKSWLIDCLTSFLLSLVIEMLMGFVIAVLYIISIKKKNKIFYRILLLLL